MAFLSILRHFQGLFFQNQILVQNDPKMTENDSARMLAAEAILDRCHLVRAIQHWVEAYSGITET